MLLLVCTGKDKGTDQHTPQLVLVALMTTSMTSCETTLNPWVCSTFLVIAGWHLMWIETMPGDKPQQTLGSHGAEAKPGASVWQ